MMNAEEYKYKNYSKVLWVFTTFKEYAEKEGLRLDDENLRYIADLLNTFPSDIRRKIAHDYVRIYLDAMKDGDLKGFQRHGAARRTANTWLRENKHAFYGELDD